MIALGAGLQILSTELVPLIRNHGDPLYAIISMIAGFITNVVLDYLFVRVFNQGLIGAALTTILGQSVTLLFALVYFLRENVFSEYGNLKLRSLANFSRLFKKEFEDTPQNT